MMPADLNEMPDELRAFYARHHRTGEPPDGALEAVRQRLDRHLEAATSSRTWLPSELRLAAAALVLVATGALVAGRVGRSDEVRVQAPPPVIEVTPVPVPRPPPVLADLARWLDGGAVDPSEFVAKAKDLKRSERYEAAVALLKRCLELKPDDIDCTVSLASMYAFMGLETNDVRYNELARLNYRRFLQLAPSDDKRVERVEEILGQE